MKSLWQLSANKANVLHSLEDSLNDFVSRQSKPGSMNREDDSFRLHHRTQLVRKQSGFQFIATARKPSVVWKYQGAGGRSQSLLPPVFDASKFDVAAQ